MNLANDGHDDLFLFFIMRGLVFFFPRFYDGSEFDVSLVNGETGSPPKEDILDIRGKIKNKSKCNKYLLNQD